MADSGSQQSWLPGLFPPLTAPYFDSSLFLAHLIFTLAEVRRLRESTKSLEPSELPAVNAC